MQAGLLIDSTTSCLPTNQKLWRGSSNQMSNASTSMDSSLSGHLNDTVGLSSRSVDSRLVCS